MKTIGMIGGISWVSTIDYYKLINEGINAKLGGLEFAQCIIHSVNYGDIKRNNDANDWDANLKLISDAALQLQNSGASAIIICANTMHHIADKVQQQINIPLIHIATETAKSIEQKGLKKVGLLGTKFTMEYDFFTNKLKEKNIETIIPDAEDRNFIHYTIFEELGRSIINPESKKRYQKIINQLIQKGAEGIILGCTEIPMLIKQSDVSVPVFDTTYIHSAAAVEFMLAV